MLERERLESKKISKTQSVTSQIDNGIAADDVHIGPSDHVPWLDDRKWAYIRLEGRNFGDVPLNVELKLEVWDSPNSAGVIIDALRCAKLAQDRGIGGPLLGPSAYFMKSPPVQYHDDEAHRMVEEFAAGRRPRRRGAAPAVPTDNAAAWDRYAAAYQAGAQLPTTRRPLRAGHPDRGRAAPARRPQGQAGPRARLRGRAVLDRLRQAGGHRHRGGLLGRAAGLRPPAVRARGGPGRAAPGGPGRPGLPAGRLDRPGLLGLRLRLRRGPQPGVPPGPPGAQGRRPAGLQPAPPGLRHDRRRRRPGRCWSAGPTSTGRRSTTSGPASPSPTTTTPSPSSTWAWPGPATGST